MIEIKRLLARPPIWYIIYYATRVLKFLTGQKLLTKVKSTTGKGPVKLVEPQHKFKDRFLENTQGLEGGKAKFKELSHEFSKNFNSKNCHH